jgi:hypothetical protein
VTDSGLIVPGLSPRCGEGGRVHSPGGYVGQAVLDLGDRRWELVGQALAVRRDTDGTYGTHGTYGSRRFARTRDCVLNVPIEDEYDDAGLRTVNLLHCFCYLLAVFRVFHGPTQVGDLLSQRIA